MVTKARLKVNTKTNPENFLSILSKGLIIDAPYAMKTGRAFGDGIYFADILDKSANYGGNSYILLCDVDLGNCQEVEDTNYHDTVNGDTSATYDSRHVRGQNIPDSKMDLKTKNGYVVPLGKIIPKSKDQSWGWRRQNYSEYVIFKPENIAIRYIVHMGNGSKKYSMKGI